jgi:hypothetical protein
MAIFGIGAHYDTDVTQRFLSRGFACVGWDENDAPPAHAILRQLRTGDIIFIKSWNPQAGLTINAVRIVMEGRVRTVRSLGSGVPVRWAWSGEVRIGNLSSTISDSSLKSKYELVSL